MAEQTRYEKIKAIGKNIYRDVKDTVCAIATAGMLIGIVGGGCLALEGIQIGLRAGGEAVTKTVFNESRYTHRGTLIDLHKAWLLQTKGYLQVGEFRLDNRTTVRIFDSARVLEGKLFDNSRMPYDRKNISKKYDLEFFGSETTGYSLLKAEPVERN